MLAHIDHPEDVVPARGDLQFHLEMPFPSVSTDVKAQQKLRSISSSVSCRSWEMPFPSSSSDVRPEHPERYIFSSVSCFSWEMPFPSLSTDVKAKQM
jgi:hypothetical protein